VFTGENVEAGFKHMTMKKLRIFNGNLLLFKERMLPFP
jgi:hypothetical protein